MIPARPQEARKEPAGRARQQEEAEAGSQEWRQRTACCRLQMGGQGWVGGDQQGVMEPYMKQKRQGHHRQPSPRTPPQRSRVGGAGATRLRGGNTQV